ncbi:MAG: membrane protein insertase YidC [Planctomycetota bacterium]
MEAKQARRIFIPLVVLTLASLVVVAAIFRKPPPSANQSNQTAAQTEENANDATAATDETETATGTDDAVTTVVDDADETTPVETGPLRSLDGLYAIAPDHGFTRSDADASSLGSLDPTTDFMLVEFTLDGAGIERLTLSDTWDRWYAAREADAHNKAVAEGADNPPPLPPDEYRYVVTESRSRGTLVGSSMIPSFSAFQIVVNGDAVELFNFTTGENGERRNVWAETAPGRFETTIVNAEGDSVLEVTREFRIIDTGEAAELALAQRVKNVSGNPLDIQWKQYGPSDMDVDRSKYIDRRRVRFGYQRTDAASYPASYVYATDDQLVERQSVIKRLKKAAERGARGTATQEELLELVTLWPNKDSRDEPADLSWFALTNRYFACAVHPIVAEPATDSRSLTPVFEEMRADFSQENLFVFLYSPTRTVEPGAESVFDVGIYAGPVDRRILNTEQPYEALNLGGLKIYVMSTFCAICTFQWLANLLLVILSFFHDYIWHDWALSIITLVLIVRTILHPLLKKSQISMQRFAKQMQNLKPELDKLQKKFAGDPKRMQVEQMRLFREHGVNPLGCLSILPMLLQTPIWIALYAMLYFAFDLRQDPGFYGIFQQIGGWPFLADLSASDHMLGEFNTPRKLLWFNLTGINVLPILMGVMFFFQQRYMSPPPSPNITPEQLQQQRIMRFMFVIMFPVMLYSAPSGLTLYILTSSSIGIVESVYIRRHIKDMDLTAKPKKDAAQKKGGKRDVRARAMEKAMKHAEQRRREKKNPSKSYKKRK